MEWLPWAKWVEVRRTVHQARLAAKNFREAVYGYKIVGNFFEDPEWYNEIKRGKYKDDLNSNDDDGFDDIWDRIDPESDGDDEA